MNYRTIDMASYERRSHFEYFKSLSFPYVGTTVNVDITDFLETVRRQKLPFFLSFCYCVSRAANRVPQFRQRIRGNSILEYSRCLTSHTVALEDGTYRYCTLDSGMEFSAYLPLAVKAQEEARQSDGISESSGEAENMFFLSTLPWLSYSALIQPVPIPADSNPRITWGKYQRQGERMELPVSVLCHHALVDGLHIASFYRFLDEELKLLSDEAKRSDSGSRVFNPCGSRQMDM